MLIVIKDRRLQSRSIFGKRVYQPTRLDKVVLWRRSIPLTLDEEEHEAMTLQGVYKEFLAGNM